MSQIHLVRSTQDLGLLIARARKNRGQSQRKLAAKYGVSQAWLSRVELGYQKTWTGKVLRLAVYLGIELTASLVESAAESERGQEVERFEYPDLDNLV